MGMATCLKCGLWHHGECEEVPDVSKLPAFPGTFSPADISWEHWLQRDRDAALARMEALKRWTSHAYNCQRATTLVPTPLANRIINDSADEADLAEYARLVERAGHCTCGLDALLAACERRSER